MAGRSDLEWLSRRNRNLIASHWAAVSGLVWDLGRGLFPEMGPTIPRCPFLGMGSKWHLRKFLRFFRFVLARQMFCVSQVGVNWVACH